MPNGSTALPLESVQRALGFVPSGLEAWSQMGTGLLRVTKWLTPSKAASRSSITTSSKPPRACP